MAELEEVMPWPIEPLPPLGRLYYRVNIKQMTDGELGPNVFRENKGSMSADWSKYSSASQTRERATIPRENGIVTFIVEAIRSIPELTVQHDPVYKGENHIDNNRAHTGTQGISGPNKVRIRSMLFRQIKGWEIDPFDS